jgi:hypothetical protein
LCWIKDFSKYLNPKTKSKRRKIEKREGAHILYWIWDLNTLDMGPEYIGYGGSKENVDTLDSGSKET